MRGKKKKYILVEFPYPSGEGLHMGHLRPYVAGDVYSRFLRMNGYEVMYPIGWDAFGLPAENFAIKKGIQPAISTAKNIQNAKKQLKSWGMSFDWSREINTTDPNYYKWTQWIFLQFFKSGLAYEAKGLINWCPKDKTGLANEEVINGCCERCGTKVEKKEMRQWYLKITAYAEKLLKGLKNLDWPEQIKIQQKNWIGKSEGAVIKFQISNSKFQIEIFTTRPDTLFGATYIVLAPENSLIENLKLKIENWGEVNKYIQKTTPTPEGRGSDRNPDGTVGECVGEEKTGVELKGIKAINPANQEEIPIWISNYVLASYGTGAIMAVPAHDQRDFEFATKFKLPIKIVICQNYPNTICPILNQAYESEGYLVDSEKFNGLKSQDAKWKITKFVNGKKQIQYHLRDWVFSRQRYWGEPIPIIHCKKCGIVPVPEKDLPIILPKVEKYQPTGTGESPLAAIDSWVNTKCPKCNGPAKRETNTMPQWAGSSWYYIGYIIAENLKSQIPISKQIQNPKFKKLLKYWLPVDVYFGGLEHTTLHLLYSRFWHLFLYDKNLVPTSEPYLKRVPHGIILGPDGEKMSKSRGNIVSPDAIIKQFGADCLRMYELFLGPHEATVSWKSEGIVGINRFLKRIRALISNSSAFAKASADKQNQKFKRPLHQTIKKVTEDIKNFRFNTAISALMILVNEMDKLTKINKHDLEILLKLLTPFAPYLSDKLWKKLGHKKSIHLEKWPKYDKKLIQEKTFELVIQINGKMRDKFEASINITKKEAEDLTLKRNNVQKWLEGKTTQKIIFVPNKLINIVV